MNGDNRTHDALGKDIPHLQPIDKKLAPEGRWFQSNAWVVSTIATHGAKQRRRTRFGLSAIVDSSGGCGARGIPVCLSGHRAENPKPRYFLNFLPCRGLGIDYIQGWGIRQFGGDPLSSIGQLPAR